MSPTLYFHIGLPKAGTTSLQNCMWPSFRELRREGIVVLTHSGSLANLDALNAIREPDTQIAQNLHRFFGNALKKNPRATSFAISEEGYCTHLMPHRNDEQCVERSRAVARTIHQSCHDLPLDVRIILYLRRQDHWLLSCFGQFVLSGGSLGFEEYRSRYGTDGLDWRALIQAYLETFSKEQLIVRCLDPKYLSSPESLVRDFGEIVGSVFLQQHDFPAASHNLGYGRSMTQIAMLTNTYLSDEEKVIFRDIFQSFDSKGVEDDGASTAYFPHDERRRLLDQFESGNQWIAEQFLNDHEGGLFSPISRQEDTPHSPLRLEVACIILARALVATKRQEHDGLMTIRLLRKLEGWVQAYARRHPRVRSVLRGILGRLGVLSAGEYGGGNIG